MIEKIDLSLNAFPKRGRWLATCLLLLTLPLFGQSDAGANRKYQKELAAMYESLEITDIRLKSAPYKSTDIFRPTFSVRNATNKLVVVPLQPGRPSNKSSALGQAMWDIRRVGAVSSKAEHPRFFIGGSGPKIIEVLEPHSAVEVEPPNASGYPIGQTIQQLNLFSGEYEITFHFGVQNGPRVKPTTMRFLVDNPEITAQQARENVKKSKAMKASFEDFAHDIFAATKQGEVSLSLRQVKAGGPLEATFVLTKVAGKELPAMDKENSNYGLKYIITVTKASTPGGNAPGSNNKPGLAGKGVMLDWAAIETLRQQGSLTMTLPIETGGLPAGNYEVSVSVNGTENMDHAPRTAKARFSVFK